jgi:hypothetical protein
VERFTRELLEAEGFTGFVCLQSLDELSVPQAAGIYAVVRDSEEPPTFMAENPGGRHKQRDPTVPTSSLTAKWIDECCVLYIGKAENLRRRLKQYRQFGLGQPVGHWGGRYVWQLADACDLLVCWKPTIGNARDEEIALLARFRERHGRLPFANINS